MIHKLLAGKGKMKRGLSLLLCLALLGSSVISANVTAEAESEVTAETAGTTEDETDDTVTVEETTDAEEQIVAAAETGETTAESATETTTEEVADTAAMESTSPAVTLTGSYDGVDVTVEAPEGAFAEGVTMVVSEADVEAFKAAVLADCVENYPDETYTVIDAAVVDITFFDADGNEVEPAKEVNVTLSGLELATEDSEGTHTANYALVYHMNDDGSIEWIEDKEPGQQSYGFVASRFSSYGVATVEVEYAIDEAFPGEGGGDQGGGTTTTSGYYHIDLRVTGSFTVTVSNTATGQTDVTVNKIWEDDDSSNRPSSITVYLTDSSGNAITNSDGSYAYSATLTADNDWSYTWEDVSLSDGTYSVGEETVSGYAVESTTTFTVDSTGSSSSSSTSETYTGTITVTSISSLTVTHDGKTYTVAMNAGSTPDENDEDEYEFTSVAGHGSDGQAPSSTLKDIVNMEEGDTITVTVTYSYSYTDSSGNPYSGTATTTVTHTVDEDSNFCEGTTGTDLFGYDFRITAAQLLEEENIITDDQVVTITNKPSTASITVTKQVTGNMGDTTKEFSFTLTDSDGNTISSFTLASGDSQTVDGLTIGDNVYLAESDNSGYEVTVTVDGTQISASNGTYAITVGSDVSITVTNYKNAEPDTGLNLDSAPYTLMLAGVAVLGGAVLFRRRKRLL